MAGIFNSNSYSNNKQDAGNFAIYGNLNGFGYRASSNSRKAGKITTPNGTLRNTGMIEKNQSASIGLDGDWGNFYLDSFKREQTQDLLDNPNENPGATVSQKLLHEKSHFHSFFIFPQETWNLIFPIKETIEEKLNLKINFYQFKIFFWTKMQKF
ncbi:hypothetical protein LEP1GSC115_1183 [Leptospira interrogans serovar Australis str. 200703203]|uniref:Uncharacterized protein n=1 Tax=Leptospira interrogans serovar Australis str. 200703203 TaxID=1085541 RepID=N1UFF6_LEPIR|nr:hypothetical protein LEP1GSC115_1183 [Leptospira interrogans serovar Australis str. 200703203]